MAQAKTTMNNAFLVVSCVSLALWRFQFFSVCFFFANGASSSLCFRSHEEGHQQGGASGGALEARGTIGTQDGHWAPGTGNARNEVSEPWSTWHLEHPSTRGNKEYSSVLLRVMFPDFGNAFVESNNRDFLVRPLGDFMEGGIAHGELPRIVSPCLLRTMPGLCRLCRDCWTSEFCFHERLVSGSLVRCLGAT